MYATRTERFRARGTANLPPRALVVNRASGMSGADCCMGRCTCKGPARVAPGRLRTMSGPAGVRRTRNYLGDPFDEVLNITNWGSSAYGSLLPPILAPSIPGILPPIPGVSTPTYAGGSSSGFSLNSLLSSVSSFIKPVASIVQTFTGGSRQPNASGSIAPLTQVVQAPIQNPVLAGSGISQSTMLALGGGALLLAIAMSGRRR